MSTHKKLKTHVRLLFTTSGLEMEWDYSDKKREGMNKMRTQIKRIRKGKMEK